jgi:hypothetical protein
MNTALNHVDICFVVDTTGSMGQFIAAAQQHLLDTIGTLQANSGIDLQLGLVEYRDHPPEDRSFVTRIYPLTPDLKRTQKAINRLKAHGGGDAPEAVYDGVHAACTQMKWRTHSCRFVLLVGDAPPHGPLAHLQEIESRTERRRHGDYGDKWAAGCPCGLTVHSVTAGAENHRATIHALCMSNERLTLNAFTEIALGTGGQCASATEANAVVGKITEVLTAEFSDLEFDRGVLEIVPRLGNLDVSQIADALGCPRLQAASSIARLGKRGFLEEFRTVGV